ncbi:MAG: hypothetical protein JWQ58_1096 [Reyranella sp.]|nr:hypothetical protein [Reyranella sp.]
MTASKKPPKKPPKKPGTKSARPRATLDPALSIPPAADPKVPAGKAQVGKAQTGKERPGAEAAAEALERLSKMTPEEQAAALFQTILASSGKKSW